MNGKPKRGKMPKKIGIIGAMRIEVESLADMLENRCDTVCSGITYHEGRLHGTDVVLAVCGVGKVFAAVCAQTMIIKYNADLIVNTGVAGGLDDRLHICDAVIAQPLEAGGKTVSVTCVSMGNPHCVTYIDDTDSLDIEKIGPVFENHPAFPDRINTEFIQVVSDSCIKMRVWERGAGETLACGTGACAATVASILNGYCKRGEDIKVILRGGELKINWTHGGDVYMTGPAETVCTGEIDI